MSTTTQPYGKPEEAKKSEGNTAQEKKQAAQTKGASSKETSSEPKVNKDVWAQAEQAVLNKNGGWAGVSPEGRKAQIQEQYDQMVSNDESTKKWAGEGGGVLGDTK